MKTIITLIQKHQNSSIKETIDQRMKEFESFQNKNSNDIFKELCFCLLTANYSAEGGIKIQNAIGNGFLTLNEPQLAKLLAENGHRFPNMRAKFIFEAQQHKDTIKDTLQDFVDEVEARNWIVQNIKGIGFKEASHFLRNIGYKNVAIIDFHIVDLLARHDLIEQPKSKSLTPKKYLEIENVLKELSEKTQIPLGELDLYLWYEETGKILK